jgi:hypothetical protein
MISRLIIIFVSLSGVTAADAQKVIEIKGIYGSPQKLWDKGFKLNELGVNAIFLHDNSITAELMSRAKKEGVKVFAEFATLNGKGYVEDHPEAWAIDNKGDKVKPATWFMGVCPTEPGFRKYRTDALHELLNKYEVSGVWMDYLHWHAQFEDPEPILPETCFCDRCITAFEEYKSISVAGSNTATKAEFILQHHDTAWRNWRCTIVASWVKEFKQILNKQKPGALLGIYHCPWHDDDFNSARRRILGLDYAMLYKHADVFSPMVYHKRMGRSPEWVKQNIEWFSGKAEHSKIWPIVQAYNDPSEVTAAEFEMVLRNGLSGKSTGVMMFTTDAVASDPEKIDVMKKVYSEK